MDLGPHKLGSEVDIPSDRTPGGRPQTFRIGSTANQTDVDANSVDVASCSGRAQPGSTRLKSTDDPVLPDGEVYADVRSIDSDETDEMTEAERKFQQRINEIDLSGLSDAEKERTIAVIWEKREAFAMTEDEVGDAPDLMMEINTTDEVPVQKCYNAIPKPLRDEIKSTSRHCWIGAGSLSRSQHGRPLSS